MNVQEKSICEEKNFKILFENHSEVIRNFIYYKCGDIAQAEDLTQDAFIKLWQNCKKVIFEKAKSFLMKVAQNAFYNEVNHKKVVLKYNEQAISNKEYVHDPEFLMEEKEFMLKLQQSIAALPEKQRAVFLLSRKDKKTYKEIAEIIGLTQKAVEKRMHLALVSLRKKLGRSI